MKSKSLKVSFIGMMVALSFVLSYIESLIPLSVGIPGVKAGLSNIPVMVTLYMTGPLIAGILALTKVTLVSLTFGSMSSFFYSLSGAMLSIIIMAVFKRLDIFTVRGLSILGGIMHNMGQLIVAVFISIYFRDTVFPSSSSSLTRYLRPKARNRGRLPKL